MTTPNVHECTIAEAAMLLDIYYDHRDPRTGRFDPVMLWGPMGVGKSDIVNQLGARKRVKVIEFHAALREPVDLRGIPVADPKTGTTKWFTPDELPREERDGPEGILFIDEYVQAMPQMQAVLGGLLLYGVVGEYRLPKGWRVIAAGNRMQDKSATNRMPNHIRNRFAHIHVVADVVAWCDWANQNDIAPELVAFIRLRRDHLHVPPKGDEAAFPTPRSWTACSKFVGAPKAHRMRLFAGHVGDAYAAEFDGFIDLYRSIGSLDDIVADPANAKVPTEPSIRFATCTGLARIATKKNFAAVVQYAKRLPRESQILVVHDATTRDATLKNTATYGSWAVENQDLMIQ